MKNIWTTVLIFSLCCIGQHGYALRSIQLGNNCSIEEIIEKISKHPRIQAHSFVTDTAAESSTLRYIEIETPDPNYLILNAGKSNQFRFETIYRFRVRRSDCHIEVYDSKEGFKDIDTWTVSPTRQTHYASRTYVSLPIQSHRIKPSNLSKASGSQNVQIHGRGADRVLFITDHLVLGFQDSDEEPWYLFSLDKRNQIIDSLLVGIRQAHEKGPDNYLDFKISSKKIITVTQSQGYSYARRKTIRTRKYVVSPTQRLVRL